MKIQNLKRTAERLDSFTKTHFDVLEEYQTLIEESNNAVNDVLDSLKIKALASRNYSKQLYENLRPTDKKRLERFAQHSMFKMDIKDIYYNMNDGLYYYTALRTNIHDYNEYKSHGFTEDELTYFLTEVL